MSRVCRGVVYLALVVLCSSVSAAPIWFDEGDYFFLFTGTMGPGDIDRVTPSAHAILGGHEPGREWFAWATVNNPEVVLSSWEGYDPVQDLFLGFLGSDLSSSPVPIGPAIGGVVRPDGGIYICISSVENDNCVHGSGNGGLSEYTFFLALAPNAQIDEPSSLLLAAVALAALFMRVSRNRIAGQ